MNALRGRLGISAQLLGMTVAGVVALVVLVAAVVALPRSETRTAATQTSDATSSTEETGSSPSQSTAPGGKPSQSAAGSAATAPAGPVKVTASSGIGAFATKPSRFVPAKAPGITSSTVYIGIFYSSQAASANRALGAGGAAATYDTRDVFNATIDYANKHGGFAGRKLKALYYDYDLTGDTNTEDQSACAFWTQDNKVFSLAARTDIGNACAEKAGAIPYGGGAATSETFKKFPHLIAPDETAFDRLGKVTVNGLNRAKYFSGKLGLVTWDSPQYKLTINNGYLPSLSKIGVKPVEIAYIGEPSNLNGISDSTAAVASAVARFKAAGIDHVIIQDGPAGVFGDAGLTFLWMNQSKSQNYYPRYGQNAHNAPGWDVLPADQMNNALAVDDTDLEKKFDEGWRVNKFREDCFKIQRDAGYPVSSDNINDQLAAGTSCDAVFLLQRIFNSSSRITRDSFLRAFERLGTSQPSALVYGTKLFSGRRDGSNMFRNALYLESCRCLKYQGPPAYSD